MEFKSQICTTKEQSERLLNMGLSEKTADCHFEGRKNKYEEWEVVVVGRGYCNSDFPAWSLHRLIEIANAMFDETAENLYDDIIATIQSFIHLGCIKEEYLDMDIVNANEEKNMELLKNGGK